MYVIKESKKDDTVLRELLSYPLSLTFSLEFSVKLLNLNTSMNYLHKIRM